MRGDAQTVGEGPAGLDDQPAGGLAGGVARRLQRPASPERALLARSAGRASIALLADERKWVVTIEPSTATPRAPPSSRVVSLVAEPMPARSGGTDVMIIAVNGLIVTDMPAIIGTSGK